MSSTIKVKFLIDREQKRVVFAEAGSDFVDVLFSFLTLPLGRIVRLLNKQSCLGSLDSVYHSVEQLDVKHLQTEACQDMLLNPRSAAAIQCEDLKIKGIHDPRYIYTCSQDDCLIRSTCYYTYSTKVLCHLCGKLMDKASKWSAKTSEEGGTFVDDKFNFIITDDLRVMPNSLLNGLSLFKEMQIKEASMLEERVIDFGTEEALNLLGKSLVSKNALTLVCFPDAPVQENAGFSLPIKEEIIVNKVQKEINLKLVLNKEKNDILYAEVGEDFINLLLSFLTFPLGSCYFLLLEPDRSSWTGPVGPVRLSPSPIKAGTQELSKYPIHFNLNLKSRRRAAAIQIRAASDFFSGVFERRLRLGIGQDLGHRLRRQRPRRAAGSGDLEQRPAAARSALAFILRRHRVAAASRQQRPGERKR